MKTAQEWINDLTNGTSQAYPNIQRTDMVSGLTLRLKSPRRIDQANTSLCGAASLMYCLATHKDAMYAQYVVELYNTGKSTIGKLTVEPGSDCKEYKPSTSQGIHPVDWVALASLRDSENDAFDYAQPSDEVGGITMPGDLVDWFKDAGFSQDANITNVVFTKGEATIKEMAKRFDQQHSVCMFINSIMLSDPTEDSWTPDHWVVVTSAVAVKDKRVTLSVFTWGDIKTIDLPKDDFCENYYGFISSTTKSK